MGVAHANAEQLKRLQPIKLLKASGATSVNSESCTSMHRYAFIAVCAALSLTCAPRSQGAETDAKPGAPAAQSSEGAPPTQQFSVKNTFRNICGFCHENYGRKAGKGPQLMATQLTDEQIFNRIKNGKPGRMAAFGGAFTDEQISQIVAFIRTLRPDVDP